MKSLAVIIPCRANGNPYITLESLGRSTFQDFSITIQQDQWGNANKARNAGFKLAPASEFVLFSDDDIRWEPDGIGAMIEALAKDPEAAYAYGSYEMGGRVQCTGHYSAALLRRTNLASTMCVHRRLVFKIIKWDESLDRLQDYDVNLQIAAKGGHGIQCDSLIFRTDLRDGITRNGKVSYQEAFEVLRKKHGL